MNKVQASLAVNSLLKCQREDQIGGERSEMLPEANAMAHEVAAELKTSTPIPRVWIIIGLALASWAVVAGLAWLVLGLFT